MKEQVITPRAGRGGAAGKGRAGEVVQKPAARRGHGGSSAKSGRRKVLAYLPLAGKVTLAVTLGVLLFAGYRAAASASFFQARNIDVSGTSRASAAEVREVVRRRVAQMGVWRADLEAISRELKGLAWVREAVVSRVLPDGLRVRVFERQPRAVIRTSAGKFQWVDDDAVMVGAATPSDQIILRGWDEEGTDAARAVNRERVRKFLSMTGDWEAGGVSGRVSEVNLGDPEDVRAQLTGEDSHIEVQLGGEDFGRRLKFALEELDRQRGTPIGPFILHINVAQGVDKGRNVTIGVSPDAPNFSAVAAPAAEGGPEVESARVSTRGGEAARRGGDEADREPPPPARKAKEKGPRAGEEQPRAKEQAKKEKDRKEKDRREKASPEAKAESRPRRVGR